ncbi:hypothetical protein VTL71DRAFT_15064 [Oculimacula yallundae]|uniref:Uncharacterized protein n=1 Tax=Oculimacula yallundae TaxID=86028 RepID=A0ABR4CFI1_9HELO
MANSKSQFKHAFQYPSLKPPSMWVLQLSLAIFLTLLPHLSASPIPNPVSAPGLSQSHSAVLKVRIPFCEERRSSSNLSTRQGCGLFEESPDSGDPEPDFFPGDGDSNGGSGSDYSPSPTTNDPPMPVVTITGQRPSPDTSPSWWETTYDPYHDPLPAGVQTWPPKPTSNPCPERQHVKCIPWWLPQGSVKCYCTL